MPPLLLNARTLESLRRAYLRGLPAVFFEGGERFCQPGEPGLSIAGGGMGCAASDAEEKASPRLAALDTAGGMGAGQGFSNFN